MDLHAAEKRMKEWAAANSSSLGLKGADTKAEYIWNPGGFVNQSYRISDGETIRHVKLSTEENASSLKQWTLISEYLSHPYHAPRLVGEVTQEILPGYSYGLVFEYIKGEPLSSISNPDLVVEKLLNVLKRLHSDAEIRRRIPGKAKGRSYAEAFIEEYVARFEEDMQVIRAKRHLLAFVTDSSLDWFDHEVEALKQMANRNEAFQKQAQDIVHNDLNWQNVLVEDSGHFWIIDWDNLVIDGDAAMDYSVLLWPMVRSPKWPWWKERVVGLAGEELLERMELYFRAKLLDDVIDILADYVEAESIPEVKEKTQRRAKEIHLHAYPEYVRLYAK
ncbi:aminoglycoside phosphotransferase family protein [Paenibacillus sp. OAS669]|uniref:aminoglycoside phosphotransferase family protein n=1 Tax=Paenibacillus sp. OAS669 TaxID=2663821 RepID=UPI001789AAF0|nr:aminoglycoside phosphotransferase family protein [Paenibacillus sp. OAS669]MBE1442431.1 aminoglycoside phosphotransferase (APT) family kinase protein [Paenibacillus sp. OAS669]